MTTSLCLLQVTLVPTTAPRHIRVMMVSPGQEDNTALHAMVAAVPAWISLWATYAGMMKTVVMETACNAQFQTV